MWRKFEPEWDKRYGRWTGDFSTDPISSQTIIVYSRGHLFSAFAIDGQYRPTSIEREAKLGGDLSPWDPMQTEWGQYVGIPRWMSEYVSSPGRIQVERATDTLLVNMAGAGTAQLRLLLKDLRWKAVGTTTRPVRREGEQVSFTADDGRTWFTDTGDNLPPYEVDGRTAVRAFVFAPPNAPQARFVGYLMQYDEAARQAIRRAKAEGRPLTAEEQQIVSQGTHVKRPGEQKWVPLSDKPEITNIRANGGAAVPVVP